MATILAKNMRFYSGTTAFTCQVDVSISESVNMFNTTCKDSGANAAFSPGEQSWTASGTGNLDWTATYGYAELKAAKDAGTPISLVMSTGVSGEKKLSGTCYVSSLGLESSGNDAAVTFPFELQGTGALAIAAIP